MEFKTTKVIEPDSRMVVTRVWRGRGNGEMLVQGDKVSVTRRLGSGALRQSMDIIYLHLKFAKGIHPKFS